MQCHRPPDHYWTTCESLPDSSSTRGSEVYLNALASSLPSCDRKTDGSTLASLTERTKRDGAKVDRCYVYCAQRSCGAAKTWMEDNERALVSSCEEVVYLPSGALAMEEVDLVDGRSCHDGIVAHNPRASTSCLTCGDDTVPITVSVRGEATPRRGLLSESEERIPDWYRRDGTLSPLPSYLSCASSQTPSERPDDAAASRRRSLPRTTGLARERAANESTLHVTVDLRGTSLPEDALLAYWAADPSERVRRATDAYGAFGNRGISQCSEGKCNLVVDRPGQYTEGGKVFPEHVHFTYWKDGTAWDTRVKTIEWS